MRREEVGSRRIIHSRLFFQENRQLVYSPEALMISESLHQLSIQLSVGRPARKKFEDPATCSAFYVNGRPLAGRNICFQGVSRNSGRMRRQVGFDLRGADLRKVIKARSTERSVLL